MLQKENKSHTDPLPMDPDLSRDNDIRVVVFDCDGVMFDTTKANTAYYNHILRHFGRPAMTGEQIAFTQMHTVFESVAYLFEDDASLAEAAKAYREQVGYTRFIKLMEMEPDLKPLLKRLRPEYKTAIATNRSDTMSRVLTEFGIDGFFDLVICALDVQRPKPHPDALITVLDHFEILPRQMIYIGDSRLDERAANAAGVHFIAYGNRELSADFHINRLREIDHILRCYQEKEK